MANPSKLVFAVLLLLISGCLEMEVEGQFTPPNPFIPPNPFNPPPLPPNPFIPPNPFNPPPLPPNPFIPPLVTKKCMNKEYPFCYNIPVLCPVWCPQNCFINCVNCAPICSCNVPGAVCQDPRFIGADGITFYFHGKKDHDFCLVSDADLHINAHFIGKRSANKTRDFTWIQSIGVLFGDHKLYLGAEKTSNWEDSIDHTSITFDGEPVQLPTKEGTTWRSSVEPTLSITRTSTTNEVAIEVDDKFKITAKVVPISDEESRVHNYGITADDCFAHLEIGFKFFSLTEDVHGVLGQTYRDDYVSRVKMSSAMPIMSGEPKFASSALFSTDCAVRRFPGSRGGGGNLIEQKPNMMCGSRLGGPGMVCKR